MNIQKNKHWLNKLAFTLVELIVVIVILAILWTLAFISFSWYNRDAKNSKIKIDIRNLTSMMEVNLSKWKDLDDLVLTDRTSINWVNTWSTVYSWSYVLWNLKYEVWTFDFKKFGQNWDDFVYNDNWVKRDYLFAYAKTTQKLYYQFWWQILNVSWKYNVLINWTYSKISFSDAKWLISENWYDMWVSNWDTLTWSFY